MLKLKQSERQDRRQCDALLCSNRYKCTGFRYTHINFDDAEEELRRMEEFRKAQAEIEKQKPSKPASQVLFKVI